MTTNNIDATHPIFIALESFLTTAADGVYQYSGEDAVDTREPIENFLLGDTNVIEDKTTNGIRTVHAFVRNAAFKNATKELLLASDGEWTLVVEG